MIPLLLRNSARFSNRLAVQTLRQVHKGPEGAPPQRHISVLEHITRYFIICACMLSYPSYVLYNVNYIRPTPDNSLSPELEEILEERRQRRKEGKQPILQDWPVIHEKH